MKTNSGQAPSTLIPEYIGSDFDAVRTCADNIEYIKNAVGGTGGSASSVHISDTAPTQPGLGATWYCTTDGRSYVWYEDADSGQWVEGSPQSSLESNEGSNIDPSIVDAVNSNTNNIFALWKRSAAAAGYNLVTGSFEEGGVLTSSTDVLWHKGLDSIYSWTGTYPINGYVVSPNTNPVGNANYVPRTDFLLRDDINIVVRRFASVADMVADTSLSVGQIVETIGYYNSWVGTSDKPKGGNLYEIVSASTGVDDGGSFITLSNGLQAKGLFLNGIDPFQFGAKGDWDWSTATGNDDLAAWQNCIDFIPVDSEIKISGKYVFGLSGQLSIYKRITVDLAYSAFQALPSFSGSSLVSVAKTASTTAESFGAIYTFEGVKLKHARILGATPQYNYTTNDPDYGTTDHRTTTASGLLVTEIDGAHFEDITIRDFIGAGLLIGNQSAVRECTFDNINITHCGNASSSIGALTMWSPISTAANGIHNHIYFNTLRIINSFHNSVRMECKSGTTPAYNYGSFIVHFNDAQFDNANVSGRAKAQMIEIAHAGYDITFNQCLWFNPYGADSTVWGYGCLKLGYGTGYTDGVEQVILNKCRLQYGSVGHGVNIHYCQQLIIDGVKFAGVVDGSIVAATITPTTLRTTSVSEIARNTFVKSNSCDFQSSNIFPYSTASITNFAGDYYYGNENVSLGLTYKKAKTCSKSFTFKQATGSSDLVTVFDISDLTGGHTYKVNVEALISGVAVVGLLSGEFLSFEANIVGGTSTITNFEHATYASNFSMVMENIGGFTAGNFSSGNGDKFQLFTTNTTGSTITYIVNVLAL